MKKSVLLIILLLSITACFAQTKNKPDPKAQYKHDGDIAKPASDSADGNSIYSSAGLQVKPEYPGGLDAFYKYFEAHLDYKNISAEYDKTFQLRVYVSFVVEKDGTITGLKILRDAGYGSGKEVERILTSDKTRWSPGIQNGKPVRAQYILPITISTKEYNGDADDIVPDVSLGSATINRGYPMGDDTRNNVITDNNVYAASTLQVRAEFPGGIETFTKLVNSKIKKENLTKDIKNKELKIYVKFIIEKDGEMTGIKILRDPGYGMGQETERVLKLVKTKWSPGIQNGKPVRAQYDLPIIIKLQE